MHETDVAQEVPIVAAFDFDGTITYRDSLLPFLWYTTPTWRACLKFLAISPVMVGYALGLVRRQGAKEVVLSRFFGGKRIWNLQEKGAQFAKEKIPLMVRPEAMERLRWHKEQRHRCILVSASVDVYLEPWAKMVGFDEVLCSQLQVTRSGEITGRLFGKNCWGPEKCERLDALLGEREEYHLYAYGDSRGDHDLLSYADHPFYRRMPEGGI